MAATTPEDALKEKQAELKDAQDGIAKLNSQVTTLQTDIKTLQAKVADLNQSLSGYDKASVAMKQELVDNQVLIAQKSKIAEAVIKDLKAALDATIADFDKALQDQAAAVKKAWDAAQTAATDSKTADAAAQQAQADYDAVKKVPKDTDTALKDIKALLDQVAKAEAQADFVSVYFLAGEAKKAADGVKIPSADDYGKSVRDAQDALETAKSDAADKKSKADDALAAYTKVKQALDAAGKTRRTDLLNQLKNVKPKAA